MWCHLPPESHILTYSGFSSKRKNLSPFTKDFRGEEHLRVYSIFLSLTTGEAVYRVFKRKALEIGEYICELSAAVFWGHELRCFIPELSACSFA